VKRFRFDLEPLRRLRELELETAEAALAKLRSEREGLRREADGLAKRISVEREGTKSDGVEGWRLAAVDGWIQHAELVRAGLLRKEKDAACRIERQMGEVREARVRLETLERLKSKRQQEWRKEAEQEVEEIVAELVVSRWKMR
jgi:flagellar biosynthesis chaperone FliJ